MKRVWTTVMVWIVAGVLTACGGGGEQAAAPVEPTGNTVDLAIEATNFQFNEAEYRVKAGDTVNVTFASAQGMHGIDIRGVNLKMKDGETASFIAPPGEYDIVCNIMCGSGHSKMVSRLIVES